MIRRLRIALVAALAVMAGAVLPTAPAQAASPELVISTDGVNFAPAASVNLFDDLALIVPGDAMSAQLWVRNQSTTSALVRIAVTDLVIPSPEFGAAVTLTTTMNGFSYASSLGSLSNCQVIVQAQTIPAGGTVRVDLDVNMSSGTSGRDAQGETASLGFLVAGHDWAAGPFPDADGCATESSGGSEGGSSGGAPKLPFTGAELGASAFVAVGLLAVGALFVLLRRRRRDEEIRES